MKPETIVEKCFFYLSLVSLLASILCFALYIMGILPAETNAAQSVHIWSEPAKDLQADLTDGLGLSIASIALLAAIPITTLAILAVVWILRGDALFAILTLAIAVVLGIAAFGI